MEDIAQLSASLPTQIRRMGAHVKLYLDKWYEAMGKPKAVTLAEKTSIMHEIKSKIDPAGITMRQLNRWFAIRRRSERHFVASPVSPQLKHSSLGILFPTLTNTEVDHMKILVGENPNPSLDLLMLWVDSPLLPNLTLEDAHRFVKYNKVQMHTDIESNTLASGLHQDEAEDRDRSDEEETLDNHIDLLTPESRSPKSNPYTLTLDANVSPKLDHTPPISSAAPMQLDHDPRALLALLRSQLSTDELKQLLQEDSNNATAMSPTLLPGTEPIVSSNRASSKSQPLAPISPVLHKSLGSFTQTRNVSPGETAVWSDSPASNKLAWIDSVSHQNNTSVSMNGPTASVPSRGAVSRNILKDLSRLWHIATPHRYSSDEPIERLELCQKRSEELIVALERGNLKQFGLLPNKENKVQD